MQIIAKWKDKNHHKSMWCYQNNLNDYETLLQNHDNHMHCRLLVEVEHFDLMKNWDWKSSNAAYFHQIELWPYGINKR